VSQSTWLVTVKMPNRADQDPTNKQPGKCPISGTLCTDTTGSHHTVAVIAADAETAARHLVGHHITRIEELSYLSDHTAPPLIPKGP